MAASINDKEVCVVCCKKVIDKGTECNSDCKRWFHPECVKISQTEYKKIADGKVKDWKCGRVDCDLQPNLSLINLSKQMTSLDSKFNTIIDKLGKLAKIDGIDVLTAGILDIKSDITGIKDSLNNLEPRVSNSKKEIEAIKEEIHKLKGMEKSAHLPTNTTAESLLEELNERWRRAKNVILHGLKESRNREPRRAKEEDKEQIVTLLQRLDKYDKTVFSFFRLGKPKSDRHRPIKIIFQSEEVALGGLRGFSRTEKSSGEFGGVSMSNDKTLLERDYLRKLRDEMKDCLVSDTELCYTPLLY